jgi:parallel beta-helix repeat protein
VNNVTIRGLTVTGYNPSAQNGAISAGNAPGDATSGWAIDNVDVSYNQQYGIRIGDNMRVTNSRLHHNDVLNISGGGNNVLVEGNEIAYGNFRNSGSANFESGGTKFVLTDGFVARNNYVHDNVGVGLWIDEGNINYLLENNRVENNGSEGIALEISYRGVVRNNTVFNNGWKDPRARTWMWNAGIGVHATSDVEVYGNTVGGNMNGIVAIQQARGAGRFGQYLLSNLYVHDNTVTQTTIPPPFNPSAAGGAVADNGDAGLFTRNNRWVHNTYFTGANGHPFEWQGSWRTPAEWRAVGQDGDGTFNY